MLRPALPPCSVESGCPGLAPPGLKPALNHLPCGASALPPAHPRRLPARPGRPHAALLGARRSAAVRTARLMSVFGWRVGCSDRYPGELFVVASLMCTSLWQRAGCSRRTPAPMPQQQQLTNRNPTPALPAGLPQPRWFVSSGLCCAHTHGTSLQQPCRRPQPQRPRLLHFQEDAQTSTREVFFYTLCHQSGHFPLLTAFPLAHSLSLAFSSHHSGAHLPMRPLGFTSSVAHIPASGCKYPRTHLEYEAFL